MLPVTIRKRRVLVRVNVTQKGQTVVDKRHLPASALAVTGIVVLAQPGQADAVTLPVFLHAASAGVPTAGAMVAGVLTLAPNQPATAQFLESPGAGAYIFYGYPSSLPDPVFAYESFQGGFVPVGLIYANVVVGGVVKQAAFRLWKSVTPNLGINVSLTVTHP